MLISCENMSFGFNGGSLLENLCFSLNEGDRVGLIGADGEGKTTLCEAMLFNGGAIDRMGKVLDGTTVSDFDDLENAIDDVENNKYTIYHCMDCYYDSMDDLLEFPRGDSIYERYFDYDAYHRDCEYDVEEASN